MNSTTPPEDCQAPYKQHPYNRVIDFDARRRNLSEFLSEGDGPPTPRVKPFTYYPPGTTPRSKEDGYDVEAALAFILGEPPTPAEPPPTPAEPVKKPGRTGMTRIELAEKVEATIKKAQSEDWWGFDYEAAMKEIEAEAPTTEQVEAPTTEQVETPTIERTEKAPIPPPAEDLEPAHIPAPTKQPKGQVIAHEVIQSPAYLDLTKWASNILLFILSRRQYPAEGRDYWNPTNRDEIRVAYTTIQKFFTAAAPNKNTIRKSLDELMAHGFIDIVKQGNGRGSVSVYRLANEWRSWKVGSKPVFTKPLVRKGFTRVNKGTPTGAPFANKDVKERSYNT